MVADLLRVPDCTSAPQPCDQISSLSWGAVIGLFKYAEDYAVGVRAAMPGQQSMSGAGWDAQPIFLAT